MERAIRYASDILQLESFHPLQIRCLKAVYERKDVVAVMKTGSGKSAIYQAAPYLCGVRDNRADLIVLVITPLNSIMQDQVRQMGERGIKAAYLTFNATAAEGYSETEIDIVCDDSAETGGPYTEVEKKMGWIQVSTDDLSGYNILYAHPESLLTSKGRSLVRSFEKRICAVAVDEAHICLDW